MEKRAGVADNCAPCATTDVGEREPRAPRFAAECRTRPLPLPGTVLMPDKPSYPMPSSVHTGRGEPRRIGVELEFAGLDLPLASRLVADALGGEIEVLSDYEHRVETPELGPFNVELDFEYLKARGREGPSQTEGLGADLEQWSEEVIAGIARQVVPLEVVSPPLPMARLAEVDVLVAALRAEGALGTGHSPIYAFGLHLNPEMPALDAATIVAYMQAFLCLHDWLIEREQVDLSRRITPYINAFPREYVERVLAPGYAPEQTGFADDYLQWNADRNRALDLLPLLAHLDEDRVRRAIDDPRIKARPALHYRLPNCEVDAEGWGVHRAWGHWLAVEHLAGDDAVRADFCAAYLAHLERGLGGLLEPWWKQCEERLAKTRR